MGGNIWTPGFMRGHLFPQGRITGWAPDWHAGFPLMVFYFPLPTVVIAVLGSVLPDAVAFKLVTALGLLGLPVAAWAFGRLAGFRFPAPALMSAASVVFLFDHFQPQPRGGDVISTVRSEFAYSIGLAVALVFLGLTARAFETGRHRAGAAALLAVTGLCHLYDMTFAAGRGGPAARGPSRSSASGAARGDRRRRPVVARVLDRAVRRASGSHDGRPLPATIASAPEHPAVPRHLQRSRRVRARPVPDRPGVAPAAGLRPGARRRGVQHRASHSQRCRLALLAALMALAYPVQPIHRLQSDRFLPFWFLCLYLLAALGVSELVHEAQAFRSRRSRRYARTTGGVDGTLVAPLVAMFAVVLLVGLPFRSLPAPLHVTDLDQVRLSLRYAYAG